MQEKEYNMVGRGYGIDFSTPHDCSVIWPRYSVKLWTSLVRHLIGYPKRGIKGKRSRNASNLKTPAVVVVLRYVLEGCPILVHSRPNLIRIIIKKSCVRSFELNKKCQIFLNLMKQCGEQVVFLGSAIQNLTVALPIPSARIDASNTPRRRVSYVTSWGKLTTPSWGRLSRYHPCGSIYWNRERVTACSVACGDPGDFRLRWHHNHIGSNSWDCLLRRQRRD